METNAIVCAASDGAELATWSSGPSGATTVLLLHGFSLDHTAWDDVAVLLVECGFRVVSMDLRGHGASTLGSAPASVERLVEDVAQVVTALDLAPVHLVGHSLGAFVALASRTSDRLAGIVQSITSIAGTEQSVQSYPAMRIGSALFGSRLGLSLLKRERTGRLMISTWFGKNAATADLDRTRAMYMRCDLATRKAVAAATVGVDLRHSFQKMGPPTLVLCGDKDKAPPLKQSRRIAESIPNARLSVIDSAGHMVIVEEPRLVASRLVEWLRDQ